VSAHRDKNLGIEWPEIPAETPYLASSRNRAVCEGWMVEALGHKLATHHPVIEPVSAAEPGTEICDGDESKRALLKAKDIEMFAKPKPKKTGAPKKRPLPLRAKIHSKAAKKPRKKIVKR